LGKPKVGQIKSVGILVADQYILQLQIIMHKSQRVQTPQPLNLKNYYFYIGKNYNLNGEHVNCPLAEFALGTLHLQASKIWA
jgi:hypothetical protein